MDYSISRLDSDQETQVLGAEGIGSSLGVEEIMFGQ